MWDSSEDNPKVFYTQQHKVTVLFYGLHTYKLKSI